MFVIAVQIDSWTIDEHMYRLRGSRSFFEYHFPKQLRTVNIFVQNCDNQTNNEYKNFPLILNYLDLEPY